MTQNAHAELTKFLHKMSVATQSEQLWTYEGQPVPLKETVFLGDHMPPEKYVTSVRAVVLQADTVLTLRDPRGDHFFVPGGRRDPGETILTTLHREVGEETGWEIEPDRIIGCVHYEYLPGKPDVIPYKLPYFVQPVFLAQAIKHNPALMIYDEWVEESFWQPVATALELQSGPGQPVWLEAALRAREQS